MHLHLSSIKRGLPLAVAQLSMAAVEGSRVTACVHPQRALTPPIHSACLSSTRGSSLMSEAHGLLSCLLQSMPQLGAEPLPNVYLSNRALTLDCSW